MATIHAVALGHDVPDEELVPLVPQPASQGIQATRRTHSADGSVLDEGHYVELVFNVLPGGQAYRNILLQFGLNDAYTSEVTVRTRDAFYNDVRVNGLAVRPQHGVGVQWRMPFPRGVVILVKDLEEPEA